ncbi:unnamed protein product [Cylicocyclus nassatus]|uniref:DM13 domain-containing protein n=1 Tax=Cylicocyclus nassatus TaxID=53992 RepID=A0AA36ME88_CYLNA|nr:unnamed protein product [Cylicocyclus nassatus]
MSVFTFTAVFFAITVVTQTSDEQPYYGVPMGTFESDKFGVHSELYLADDHTIVLDKFDHKPKTPACTAMMIGPPRQEDEKRKVGDGILLPYTQPNFSWEEIRRRKRIAEEETEKTIIRLKPFSKRLLKYGPSANIVTKLITSTTSSPKTPPTLGPDESYEEIEYIEDEEETEEKSKLLKNLLPTFSKDGETHRQHSTTISTSTLTTRRQFPTLVTEAPFFSFTTTALPMIVFNKSERLQQRNEKHATQSFKLPNLDSNHIEATTAKESPTNLDSSFSLPPAQDEQVAFLLTNGGRLSDYKWIGLYDQCKNISVPLLTLTGVDPPREEEVGRFVGNDRNISSGIVKILNCNTILVTDLFFEATQKLPNTFFFVGLGNVTHTVQQTKARTIGYEIGDPLEPYNGDDVMVRLPKGIRTFDVDFLSIYSEDEKRSYGHVDLPSLLVPPCVDDTGTL